MAFSTEDYDVAMRAAMEFIEGTSHGTVMRYEQLVHAVLKAIETRRSAVVTSSEKRGAPPPANGFYWVQMDREKNYWSDPGWIAARWVGNVWYVPSSYMSITPEEVLSWVGPLHPPKST